MLHPVWPSPAFPTMSNPLPFSIKTLLSPGRFQQAVEFKKRTLLLSLFLQTFTLPPLSAVNYPLHNISLLLKKEQNLLGSLGGADIGGVDYKFRV